MEHTGGVDGGKGTAEVGTDENGLKIKEAAAAAGKDPHAFAKEIGDRFIDIFDQIVAYAAGTPTNVVNPAVLAHRRA